MGIPTGLIITICLGLLGIFFSIRAGIRSIQLSRRQASWPERRKREAAGQRYFGLALLLIVLVFAGVVLRFTGNFSLPVLKTTPKASPVWTATNSPSETVSSTSALTSTPAMTDTPTLTSTPTSTPTQPFTITPPPSQTPLPTDTLWPTWTPSLTPSATVVVPTRTPRPTDTPFPTNTFIPTDTHWPTLTPTGIK